MLLGDPVLREQAEPLPVDGAVDDATQLLVDDLRDAMRGQKGIGLAATQVGERVRVFVTNAPDDRERVFINPEIVETSIETELLEEGCLSIPGVHADVRRPARVRVQAWNLSGRPFVLEADEMLARVIQHELDHLNGRLFIDHLDEAERTRVLGEYEALRQLPAAAATQAKTDRAARPPIACG